MSIDYRIGDVRDLLAEVPDGSIDLVLTSPPFLALRSYLPPDHPDKAREIGSEPDPAAFLDMLLSLTEEFGRVLAPHGSLAVELGDTYSGSGGGGGDYLDGGMREGQPGFGGSASRQRDGNAEHWRAKNQPGAEWPLPKSLCMIPQLYAASLAYGHNLLNPFNGFEPWRVRNIIRWCRPNPPVSALGDKFRPATSEMVIACRARDRYFDLDAVRGDPSEVKDQRTRTTNGPKTNADPAEVLTANYTERIPSNPGGPPPLDWWEIPTQPYKGAHYATWPEALCVKPIKAMCPEKVCVVCGEPSRRIAVTTNAVGKAVQRRAHRESPNGAGDGRVGVMDVHDAPNYAQRETLGWSDCGHNEWRAGIVLDPFAGSGTTLVVAHRLGRDAIGIDIDARNELLFRERLAKHDGGLFEAIR